MELQTYCTRQETLREILNTAYAIILDEFTSKIVQERVQAIPDLSHFEGNPIELLIRIREQMEDTGVAQCSVISDKRIVDKYNNITQGYSESLTNYAHRFKQIRDALNHEDQLFEQKTFDEVHKMELQSYIRRQ